jgi:hypothetical protein
MEEEIREIKAVINRLHRRGMYEDFASSESDNETELTWAYFSQLMELTDEQVDEILASAQPVDDVDETLVKEEVRRALSLRTTSLHERRD